MGERIKLLIINYTRLSFKNTCPRRINDRINLISRIKQHCQKNFIRVFKLIVIYLIFTILSISNKYSDSNNIALKMNINNNRIRCMYEYYVCYLRVDSFTI